MDPDELLLGGFDPTDVDAQLALGRALRGQRLSPRQPPVAPPVTVTAPAPAAPGAGGGLPLATQRMQQAEQQFTAEMGRQPEEAPLLAAAQQRREESDRNFIRGLALQTMGGEALAPVGGQILKQAMAQQAPMEIPGGWGTVEGGKVVWNPAKQQEARLAHLQYNLKEAQQAVASAATLEEKQRAQQAQLDAQRQLAGEHNATLKAIAEMRAGEQGRFQAIKDDQGNVTGILNVHTGEITPQAVQRPTLDTLPKSATAEEKNRYGLAADVAKGAQTLIDEIETNKAAFGGIPGVASEISARTGLPIQKAVLTPEQIQLRAGVQQRAYEVIKNLAGTALSATEAGRIMQFVPNPRDDADTIQAKLKSAITIANQTRATLRTRYAMQPEETISGVKEAPAKPAAAGGGGREVRVNY